VAASRGRFLWAERGCVAATSRSTNKRTNAARALDLLDAPLVAKLLRLIPRGAGQSRAPEPDARVLFSLAD